MSKILDEATDAVRCLSPDEQDEIAREIRSLALEAQGFKPVPGGYGFRVSNPWMFGRADQYLVTDAQIEETGAARNTRLDVALAVLAAAIAVVIVLTLPAAWLPADFLGGHTVGRALLLIVQGGMMLLANVQCFRWLAFRRLRPVLARVPRTKE
jgi:hypothetical protein